MKEVSSKLRKYRTKIIVSECN